ncbi:MAG: NAD(P)H-binding protein, partial [Anaerolineales bacterium]
MVKTQRILVTGATGYVGGRLVPRLLDAGHIVRVLVRNPSQLQGRIWIKNVEIVQGDVLNPTSLAKAMDGMEVAYYLIHSMSRKKDFQQRDQALAHAFGQAAKKAGMKRLVYLGGLGNPGQHLSLHLQSRHVIGRILANYGVPLVEFRAAIVVGSGSAAFEMLRYTVEGLPILFCPTWVNTYIQPISIHDV